MTCRGAVRSCGPGLFITERRYAMIWIFMLALGAAATFATLGMYAVWLKVLSMALMAAVVIIVGLTGGLVWRRMFEK